MRNRYEEVRREVLTTLGRKYDQYLDFRQQDAHEFLTHMLDAIRLEEVDVRSLLPC
jgi:ubiquitin carboxyl-terminal hydrolase 16/45